jgi:hypothetical protein
MRFELILIKVYFINRCLPTRLFSKKKKNKINFKKKKIKKIKINLSFLFFLLTNTI